MGTIVWIRVNGVWVERTKVTWLRQGGPGELGEVPQGTQACAIGPIFFLAYHHLFNTWPPAHLTDDDIEASEDIKAC